MSDEIIPAAPAIRRAPSPLARLSRLGRMTAKELREILRDRRTIITLVLMPLLLYPLLNIGLRQVFVANLPSAERPVYRIATQSEQDWHSLDAFLRWGPRRERAAGSLPPAGPQPIEERHVYADLDDAIRHYQADVGVRLRALESNSENFAADLELIYRQDSLTALRVVEYIQERLTDANVAYVADVLRRNEVKQRAEPVRTIAVPLPGTTEGTSLTLLTLVPLILILMTITGAVYPAIDLTAGERERGTLEILVAAPVPRLALLLAKYFAVLTVALLTALVNLAMMAATVLIGGLGPLLFGDRGLSITLVLQVLGLLLLFATFFSALLLTLTSFARSFKEAQAYLVPLMVAAIAPGLLSLAPDLKLQGPLSIAPLLNIVLLGRDLLEQTATLPTALVVVVSTLLYALAAISVAARFFAAEAVLYSTESGWADLFRRPLRWRETTTPAGALTCLALVFPGMYVAVNGIAQLQLRGYPMSFLLLGTSTATAVLFVLLPWLAAWLRRVRSRTAFRSRWGPAPWAAWPAAAVLGLSLWPWAHELLLAQHEFLLWLRGEGLAGLSEDRLERVRQALAEMRTLPAAFVVTTAALTPAVCEEAFFRGYLFGALERRMRPAGVILGTALLFGLFHMVTQEGVAFERLATSTFMGLFLGWVAWRTQSLWPSMLLHAAHNGFLFLVAYYEPRLSAAEIGIEEQAHLPAAWLAASAVAVLLAVGTIWMCSRRSIVGGAIGGIDD